MSFPRAACLPLSTKPHFDEIKHLQKKRKHRRACDIFRRTETSLMRSNTDFCFGLRVLLVCNKVLCFFHFLGMRAWKTCEGLK